MIKNFNNPFNTYTVIENIKYFPRKTIIQLFNEVFHQLPEILADLAPEGWEHSAYYPLFHFSPEEQLVIDLLKQLIIQQYQQQFGKSKHQKTERLDFDSLIDFEPLIKKFEYYAQPRPFHPEQELCALFAEALSSMCNSGKFGLEDSDFIYEVNPPVAHKAAEIVARDLGITTAKPYRLPFIPWEKRTLISEVNFMPLQRYLFKAIRNTNFSWQPFDYEIFEFIDYYYNNYDPSDLQKQDPYYASDLDCELGIESTPNLDDYFRDLAKKLPEDSIVAYFDVFGKWPENFPPTKAFYLEWYKKLNIGK